jgi:Rps23 Pro-64 3,4-dihydroxylase Tpa1-like proline 4-hydroxylase
MTLVVRSDQFLGRGVRDELLSFAIASERDFLPTTVSAGDARETRLEVRRSVRLEDIGNFRAAIEHRIADRLPDLTSELQLSSFDRGEFEIEMVAHADGGFYKRHIDTFTGRSRAQSSDRVISCVYYFFQEPKTFSGGELRLYPLRTITDPAPQPIDIAIENDTLVAFSSWMPHEVLPVQNPSTAFADSRFSINCWVHRARHAAS